MSRPGRLAMALWALAGVGVAAEVAHGGRDRRVAEDGPAARGRKAGRIERLVHPPVEQVRVEAGWFIMGIPPSDVPLLVDECNLVTNMVLQVPPQGTPGGLPGQPDEVKLCDRWQNALENRGPRNVWIDGFTIDRTEVSQGAYRGCVRASQCSPVPLLSVAREHAGDDRPAVWITRAEAETYCEWRGGRLPTEAEWEKAARGTDGRTWPWGDTGRADEFNHGKPRDTVLSEADRVYPNDHGVRLLGDPDDSDGYSFAAPVGAQRWSRGPYGTVDQAGNVAEWVADDWSDQGYDGLPVANPVRIGELDGSAITRGGSWRDPRFLARTDVPPYASAFYPAGAALDANERALHIGFRCVYGGAVPDGSAPPTINTGP